MIPRILLSRFTCFYLTSGPRLAKSVLRTPNPSTLGIQTQPVKAYKWSTAFLVWGMPMSALAAHHSKVAHTSLEVES